MIPILTDKITGRRVSIYNAAVLRTNPLNGVRLKNTTGKHLLQGPVTVLDAGSGTGALTLGLARFARRVDAVDPSVLRTARQGRTATEIAKVLHLSNGTVRNHLSSAIGKTNAVSGADAARIADNNGWL